MSFNHRASASSCSQSTGGAAAGVGRHGGYETHRIPALKRRSSGQAVGRAGRKCHVLLPSMAASGTGSWIYVSSMVACGWPLLYSQLLFLPLAGTATTVPASPMEVE
jgi:hypothetical protein